MDFFLQNVVDGLSLGSLYSLYALGVALIFGIMRLVNFAHGELIMVGAYAIVVAGDTPIVVKAIVAIGIPVAFALALDLIGFRPARSASPATLLMISFAVSFMLQNLAILIMGATARTTDIAPFFRDAVHVGNVTLPVVNLVIASVTATLLVSLYLFLNRTTIGLQMRAAAEDFRTARLMGVRANAIIATAFAVSGILAGAGSFLFVAKTGTVSPAMGLVPVLFGFIATVIGGLGSLPGAVLGGYLLGGASVALQSMLPLEMRPFRDAFVFAFVFVFIVFRPQGLLVARGFEQERV